MGPALDADHRLVADIALGVGELVESWSSRSVRSVISTMVGLSNSRLFISSRVRKSMVKLLPQPVAPK
jgi:hypothetical protein